MTCAVAKCGRQNSEMVSGFPMPSVCTSCRIQGSGNLRDFVPVIRLCMRQLVLRQETILRGLTYFENPLKEGFPVGCRRRCQEDTIQLSGRNEHACGNFHWSSRQGTVGSLWELRVGNDQQLTSSLQLLHDNKWLLFVCAGMYVSNQVCVCAGALV